MQAHAGVQQLALPDPKNLRILVIDSKSVSRQTTTQLLRECSYQVTAVKTAREGLQLLVEAEHGSNFDLVLKEHEPPGANACRLLKRMAKTDRLTRTPVVVVSTQDERETVMSCLSLGAIDYLIKPLRQNELRHIWTRVWWWRKSQGHAVGVPQSGVVHGGRHYGAYRGPSSANRTYEATSSDSKQTKCQDEEEPTSKEGSAPDNGNGHGSNGNGSNGSKEGNGTSRVDAKPHCDIKDTGHGSNGNGHGSNNGNGHGSNGNGSNGSSDNKNGGNGNSATKGDGNGHGSNGNGASTTLAVDRHYQALVNTAEGKLPSNLAGAHDTLPGPSKAGAGRSSAFAQYTGPSSSSRKRTATSEAMPPGDCDPGTERDGGGGGASGTPGGGGEGLPGGGGSGGLGLASGGGSGQPISRSKASLQRERAAMMLRGSGASGHTLASDDGFHNAGGGGGAGPNGSGGGSGGLLGAGGGTPNNASSYHNLLQQQPSVSGERGGGSAGGALPMHHAPMQAHAPSSMGGSRSQQGQQLAAQQQCSAGGPPLQQQPMGPVGWAVPPHHPHHLGLPPGLPPALQAMFNPAGCLPPTHMLSRLAPTHSAMGRFGPTTSSGHGPNPAGGPTLDQAQMQALFPFAPAEHLAALAAAASEAHNHTAARGVHSHPHGPPHLGPLGALVMPGSEGAGAPGGVGVPPQVSHPGPPTSSATNINAMFLNQLLASGVTLQAFLGQPGPLSVPPQPGGLLHPGLPGSRTGLHVVPGGPGALPLHQQQQAAAVAAAAAAASAGWRPPFATPAGMAAAAAAAAATAAGVLPSFLPSQGGPGGSAVLSLDPSSGAANGAVSREPTSIAMGMPASAQDGDMGTDEAAARGGGGAAGRSALPGVPEPKRRRALALDKYRKKRKNLRFSKTIRYESRKQLAQQRPRVRGQFIKHGGGGPGGGGLLLDDGATGTASNGAKSGVGGADGIGDVGGEDEVQTNSRGYYEDEEYNGEEVEEDETEEEEVDGMELDPHGGLNTPAMQLLPMPALQQQQQAPLLSTLPPQQQAGVALENAGRQLAAAPPLYHHQQQQAQRETGGRMDVDAGADPAEQQGGFKGEEPAVRSRGEQEDDTTAIPAANSMSPAPYPAKASPPHASAPGRTGGGSNLLGRGGGGGAGGQRDDEAAAVVRSLLGLREAAMTSKSWQGADVDAVPALMQEAKAARSVGSQGSLSRDRGHSRGHSHGHSHSHGQQRRHQQQQESQSHSHGAGGGGQQHVSHSHGHSRPLSLHRQGTADNAAGITQAQAQALSQQQQLGSQPPQQPSAAGVQAGGSQQQQQQQGSQLAPEAPVPAGAGFAPGQGAGQGAAAGFGAAAAGSHQTASGQRNAHGPHSGALAGPGGGGAAATGRGSGLHLGERERERDRERDSGRERDREHRESGREREAREGREREAVADNGGGNGKNGSDSGSNSPDENGAGGGRNGGGGRGKGAAEKGAHGAHKGGGGHAHGHR